MQSVVSPKVVAIETAAEAFGSRLNPALDLLRSTITQSSACESTPDDSRTVDMRSKLSSHLGVVEDIQETLLDTDVLRDHISAITEATAALGWVVSDDPPAHMTAVVEQLAPHLSSLRSKTDPSHALLANSVEDFVTTVSDYVNDFRTTPLIFIGTSSSPTNSSADQQSNENDDTIEKDHTAPHLKDFRDTVTDATVPIFKKASDNLPGSTNDIISLATHLSSAMTASYHFIVNASTLPNKPSDEQRQSMLAPIIEHISAVQKIVQDIPPSDPFFNHAKAIEDSLSMFSWIVADEKPTSFITEAETAAAFYLNKVLLSTRNTPNATAHRAFVDSLKAIFVSLRAYIKEHHTTGLRYGIGVQAKGGNTPSKTNGAGKHHMQVDDDNDDDEDDPANYVTAFQEILNGPLAAYTKACDAIGGEVAKQAAAFNGAWKAKEEFIKKAFNTPKPDDVQSMVTPIGEKMGEITSIAESANPRGPLTQHLMAVSESVGALGWIVVEEKATAFVGDSAGTGQFYIDKVKMGARKTDNPEAHREWAKSLESLWNELKAYVKEHHTQKLVWNPPKKKKAASRAVVVRDDDEDDTANYVTAFQEILNGPLAAYTKACDAIGGEVAKQAAAFNGAWKAKEEFIKKAFNTPKPDDVQSMVTPIGEKMGEITSIAESANPRGPLTQHLMAVSESVGALGWIVVEEKATAFVGDSAGTGQFYIDKVKMGARKTDNPEAHREWAKSLESLWNELKAYVKEHHTQKLVWNPPKKKKAASRAVVVRDDDEDDTANYVTAFQEILNGPLAAYTKACDAIGGEVAKQAAAFNGAWKAKEEFIKKAFNTPKPDDVQSMVTPIGEKMGEITSIAESANPRGPLTQHLMAVSESVGALGWIVVEEKATAFVGDSAGTGQFYIDKVKMGARKTDNPEAHREWAKSLESLWNELKAYVKEYHTQKLVWNPPKKAKAPRSSPVVDDSDESAALDSVSAFSALITGPLSAFVSCCNTLGGDVAKQATAFSAAWKAEADLISKAKSMKKPNDDALQTLVTPIGEKMGEIANIAQDADPRGPLTQHLLAVSESVGALGWVAVDEKATSFVSDSSSAGQFYIDKVKMNARKTDQADAHRAWAKALEELWKDLKAYVKEYHTQRLTWAK